MLFMIFIPQEKQPATQANNSVWFQTHRENCQPSSIVSQYLCITPDWLSLYELTPSIFNKSLQALVRNDLDKIVFSKIVLD